MIGAVSTAACAWQAPSSMPREEPKPESGRPIVIGQLADEPAKKLKRFQPLADYLAAGLSAHSIGAGSVRITRDIESSAQALLSGDMDLYVDSPYPVWLLMERTGGTPILRGWKNGDAEYHSVVFARADRGFRTLAELGGQVLALDAINSTSGYLLPKAMLRNAGLRPMEVKTVAPLGDRNEVGYMFTKDDEITIQWVLSGKAAAGAIDSRRYSDLPAETRAQLIVVGESQPVPRQVVLARPDLSPDLIGAVIRRLSGAHESTDGMAVLETFEKTARFDDLLETWAHDMRAVVASADAR